MAVKGTSPIRVESNLQGLRFVLRSAVCEWLLLFFLLLDAAFSFFITKFAQYCELQLPCLICSRLDHVLGKEKPDFYKDLLCSDHKSEISSWVLCHDHYKLADIHGMCEECLMSFAKKETNEETYKLLVGKLGPDCVQKPFLSMDSASGSSMARSCPCCSKSWRTRPHLQKLVHSRPSKPDIPLPKSPRYRCLNRQEGLKKRKDRFSVSTTPFVLGSMDSDILSRMGYTEVKITSDSDSDFPLSDDDDIITAPRDSHSSNREHLFQQSSELLPRGQGNDPQIHKSTHTTSILVRSDLEPEKGETTTPTFFASNGSLRQSLTDINWPQFHKKTSSELPEFTSLDDIPLYSSVPEMSAVISANEVDRSSHSRKLSGSGLADRSHKTSSMFSNITHGTAFSSRDLQFPVDHLKENWLDTKGKGDIEQASAMNNWESIDLNGTTTVKKVETDSKKKDAAVITRSLSDRDPRDIASSSSKEAKTSGFPSEHQRRHSIVIGSTEELSASKTASPYINSSFDKTPTVNGHVDKSQTSESQGSIESRILSKLPSIERAPSLESQEGSAGEVEGENLVDRLRREIEHGKKRISDLYKELEEERSAAAIAANQAMAMITKLQEEKAALHMEALQYLRMMEEQAEYDVDELEKANDMIAEKDKEIQDLQAELDFFRIKYPEDFPEDSEITGLDLEDAESSYQETIEFEKS
ncbi:hypothetical protein RND81_07G019500 [Saponaria officinalis]|uniref:GTD-binding domain-containing protein n=1 Tax=Saponaria officinalis TaxID=3572 RepID=A0AAW1JKZ4_SAPOF